MGKLWWVSRVLPVSALVGAVVFMWFAPPSLRIPAMVLVWGLIAVVGFGIGRDLYRNVERRRPGREPDTASYIPIPAPHWSRPKIKVQNYCADCGAQFKVERYKYGFDPATGKEIIQTKRGCPNFEKASRARYGGGRPVLFGSDWPNCGDDVQKYKPAPQHTHPNEWRTDVSCPACIDQMLADGIITDQQASDLLRKAGIS